MGHRVVGGGAVARQGGRLVDGQILRVLAEIIPAGRLDTVAAVAVEVGVAVELHDVRLGVFFLDLRGQQNLHNLSGKGLLLGQIGVFNHLLGDGAAALGHPSAVLDQSQSGPEGGDPIHPGVALETPVLLGDVGILQVQADVPDVHVLVVPRVDQADLIAVLIVDQGVREHGKILAAHLSQLVISHFTALVQLRFYLDVQNGGSNHGAD